MTSYAWVCFSCQQSSPAGTDVCVHCGAVSEQTGASIAASQLSSNSTTQHKDQNSVPSQREQPREPGLFGAIAILVFSLVCIYGGLVAIWSGRWPGFMPPQLDGIELLLGLVSNRLAATVVGVLATLIGVGGVAAILFSGSKHNDA